MENKLAAFIVELATTARTLEAYEKDEEAAMKKAGLSEEQKKVLRGGDWKAICKFFGDDDPRPVLQSQEGGSGLR